MVFEPVVLKGKYVRLEPLSEKHKGEICHAGPSRGWH